MVPAGRHADPFEVTTNEQYFDAPRAAPHRPRAHLPAIGDWRVTARGKDSVPG